MRLLSISVLTIVLLSGCAMPFVSKTGQPCDKLRYELLDVNSNCDKRCFKEKMQDCLDSI